MVSSSKTSQSTATENSDERIIADGSGIGVNSGGGEVKIQFVADEAFQLAEIALESTTKTFAKALQDTQAAARSESAQLGEQIIKIGIPALALVFLIGRLN